MINVPMVPASDLNTTPAPSKIPQISDLGRMDYARTYQLQCEHHRRTLEGLQGPVVLLVEHDPVITVSRRAAAKHLVASAETLARMGIDVQPTDRGGDVTYHGPGQLVAYPILRLADLRMNVGAYLRFLEEIVIQTVAAFGIRARRDTINTGVWVDLPGAAGTPAPPAKLCAMGIRVRRNVTLHGLALNVTTDLSHFQTILPCGLAGYGVTSLEQLLANRVPTMAQVKARFAETLLRLYPQSLNPV